MGFGALMAAETLSQKWWHNFNCEIWPGGRDFSIVIFQLSFVIEEGGKCEWCVTLRCTHPTC